MEVRLARPEDEGAIGELVQELYSGTDLSWVDWTGAWPWWLVAELDGVVVACVQISPGLPVGRAENLAIDKALPHRMKALATRELVLQAMTVLRRSGAQAIMAMVPFELKSYRKLLEKRGGAIAFSGHTVLKRL